MNRIFFSFMLLAVLSACDITGPEPVSVGHYFIDNQTHFTLHLAANDMQFDEDVPADSLFHFYTAEVGTGGSAAPHHVFSQFHVTAMINNADSVLYNGVYPEDWEDWAISNGQRIKENPGAEYYLTIPR